jgi:ADP-heptose:LPS heptosyltransferase
MKEKILIEQHKNFALGNFVMLTPTIKKLSEIYNEKIDVYFNHDYVKQCYLDCEFINIVSSLYKAPNFGSSMINKELPDYQYVYKSIIKEPWSEKYHTYVDDAKEYGKKNEKYLLLLNGLGGLSLNPNDPKPHWYGKKEMTEETFYYIKKETDLPIYFTGSESDLKQNPWVNKLADVIEIGNIRKSLSLVRDAHKIISNDTGLAHCAGAMNKDILIIWKDTPFIKNQNPGKNTNYSQKDFWFEDIKKFLNK